MNDREKRGAGGGGVTEHWREDGSYSAAKAMIGKTALHDPGAGDGLIGLRMDVMMGLSCGVGMACLAFEDR